MYSGLGGYAHVIRFGLICSCTHVWADMLMYSCLSWYAHVLTFGLVYSCNNVWAGRLMYPCLGWYAHVISIIVFCGRASVPTYKRWPVCPHTWVSIPVLG